MLVSTMLDLGVATHTGRVRSANEDDFLLYSPQTAEEMVERGWFLAIADGMGGTTGGAEASRTAVRASVRPHLATTIEDPGERMRACFAEAASDVFRLSRENPTLREMGTTLTIMNCVGQRLILGHVGDTRCLRVRDGEMLQLTEDHAISEPESYLTRCVGAGQREVEADVTEHAIRDGDRYVLLTDGMWGMMSEAEIRRLILTLPAQDAAEELVHQANRRGGPDNCTVVILFVRSMAATEFREVDLPTEELRQRALFRQPDRGLVVSRWPWVLLILGLLILALAVARLSFDFDPIGDFFDWLR